MKNNEFRTTSVRMTSTGGYGKTLISEETSKRITSLRFLLAVLVVFIHNNYTAEDIAEAVALGGAEVLFNQNAFGRWVQLFISGGIARCVLPLFFLFAAYLQARKNDSYGVLIKKKSKSLVVPYFLWMLIYGFYFVGVKLIVVKIAPQFLQNPDSTALSWSFLDWVHKVFGYRTPVGLVGDGPEFAGQFWFVRDLIIFTVLSPILINLIKRFPVALLALFWIFASCSVNAYLPYVLFYYILGLYLGFYDINFFEKVDKIKWIESIFLFVLLFIVCNFIEITFLLTFLSSCLTFVTCVLILKFSLVIVRSEKLFNAAKYLSVFSFWLYAIHMPVLKDLLTRVWLKFLPMKNPFFCLAEYFGVTVLIIATGLALGIALKKIFPKVFSLLTGGRG